MINTDHSDDDTQATTDLAGDQQRLLTELELAWYLSISRSTAKRWRRAGFLPWVRTPTGGVRYQRRAVDEVVLAWGRG